MTARMAGKVALVSGAARGQGRAHAVRLAREGADIIAFDACAPVPGQNCPPSSPAELAETVAMVESHDRRIVARQADARDRDAVDAVLREGLDQFGHVDVVVANAAVDGIPSPAASTPTHVWQAVLDANLTGPWNTVTASIPALVAQGTGGSIVLTGSSITTKPKQNLASYTSAKHGVVGLMRTLAVELAEHRIRVNIIHPTTVSTPMLMNDNMFRLFRPDLESPTLDDVAPLFEGQNLLPVKWIEPEDVANAVLFLASDEAQYITGVELPVDAGYALR